MPTGKFPKERSPTIVSLQSRSMTTSW
jgi:hypothetical protein